MIGLICHDSKIYVDDQGKYYKLSMGGSHYERYLQIADKIKLVIRTIPVEECLKEQLNIVNVPNLTVISCPTVMSVKGILLNRRKTKKIIEAQVKSVDFVVIKAPGFFGNIASEYAKKYNKPYLVEIGGCAWDALWNHSLSGKLIALYQFYKTKQLLKSATHVLYVTNEFLQKRYPTDGKSVNCSNVMLTEFEDIILDRRIEKIQKNDNKVLIGTIAAVDVKYKGQQYIIEALGKLKKQGINNYEYQLVGGGDQNYLKSVARKFGVEEEVNFIGPLTHSKVFEWLDTIDIYVQPSRTEGLPRALIEAMSRALPAFGAKSGGIPELLEQEFIFSNTSKNIDEICTILKGFNWSKMEMQARRNYYESKKYDKDKIETRRKAFYDDFEKYVKIIHRSI